MDTFSRPCAAKIFLFLEFSPINLYRPIWSHDFTHFVSTNNSKYKPTISVAILARGRRVARNPLSHKQKKSKYFFAFIVFT